MHMATGQNVELGLPHALDLKLNEEIMTCS
jgi:hypothetical protein